MATPPIRPGRTSHAHTLVAFLVAGALLATAWVTVESRPTAPDLIDHGEADGRTVSDGPGDMYVFAGDGRAALELARRDGVYEIYAVGAGQYAVRTDLSAADVAAIVSSVVEPDAVGAVDALDATDDYATWQWGLDNTGQDILGVVGTVDADIDAAAAYQAGIDGGGVTVAVIDTGVDFDHHDLTGRAWVNAGEVCTNGVDDDTNGFVDDCTGWDFANGDAIADDVGNNYHGTHVASIIAGNVDGAGMIGVAPRVKIMSLKVSNTTSIQMSRAASAIRYAVDNGADIINTSFGTTTKSSSLAAAVAYADTYGVPVVASAGNSGTSNDTGMHYPSAYPNANIISVANSGPDDARSASSNFGAVTVDLAAPGVNIIGAMPGGGHAYASGTSMAAPHVTGALALLYQANTDVDPAQARSRLLSTVDPLESLTGVVASGGRLNVARLLGLPDPDAAPPAATSTTTTTAPAGATPPAETSFDGFGALTDAVAVDAAVRFAPGTDEAGETFSLEGQLLNLDDGVAAIEGLSLWASGRAAVTDAAGRFTFVDARPHAAYPARSDLGFSVALPQGRYALVVSMVDAADWALLHGVPVAVFFDVAADPVEPPATTPTVPPPVDVPTANPTVPGTGSGPDGSAPSTTNIPGDTTSTTTADPGGGGGTSLTPPSGGGDVPITTSPGTGSSDTPTTTTPATTTPAITTPAITTPDGGSASPPRTPPSDGGRDDDTPATTSPAAGSVPAPTTPAPATSTTLPPPPPPVSDGAWRIESIAPRSCEVSTSCPVVIYGTFPATPHVWFGTSVVSADNVTRSGGMLILDSPAVASAKTVDVALRGNGADLTQRDAFTFTTLAVPPAAAGPPTTSPAASTGGGATTTTVAGGGGGGSAPEPSTTTTIVDRSRRRGVTVLGEGRVHNGLRLNQIVSGNLLAGIDVSAQLCRTSSCAAVTL
jgi:subtilisin family serine protease